MISNIGYGTFLIFMALDIVSGIFCFFMVRETKGKTLEVASGVQWQVAEKVHDGAGAEKGSHIDQKTGEVVSDAGSSSEVEIVAADIAWSRK